TSTTTATSAPPITATGVRRSAARSRARRTPPAATVPGSATSGVAASVIADPRVDPGVEHVDEQVDDDEREREEHHGRLDHRIVALVDAVEERPAEPGQAVDLLGDDDPPEQVPGLEPQDRHDRDEGVAE